MHDEKELGEEEREKREGGRKRGREEKREGGKERGREGGREGGKEEERAGGKERGREGGREGGREKMRAYGKLGFYKNPLLQHTTCTCIGQDAVTMMDEICMLAQVMSR